MPRKRIGKANKPRPKPRPVKPKPKPRPKPKPKPRPKPKPVKPKPKPRPVKPKPKPRPKPRPVKPKPKPRPKPRKSLTFKGNAKRRYGGSVDATHRRMKKKSDSMQAHMAKNKPNYKKMGKVQGKR